MNPPGARRFARISTDQICNSRIVAAIAIAKPFRKNLIPDHFFGPVWNEFELLLCHLCHPERRFIVAAEFDQCGGDDQEEQARPINRRHRLVSMAYPLWLRVVLLPNFGALTGFTIERLAGFNGKRRKKFGHIGERPVDSKVARRMYILFDAAHQLFVADVLAPHLCIGEKETLFR